MVCIERGRPEAVSVTLCVRSSHYIVASPTDGGGSSTRLPGRKSAALALGPVPRSPASYLGSGLAILNSDTIGMLRVSVSHPPRPGIIVQTRCSPMIARRHQGGVATDQFIRLANGLATALQPGMGLEPIQVPPDADPQIHRNALALEQPLPNQRPRHTTYHVEVACGGGSDDAQRALNCGRFVSRSRSAPSPGLPCQPRLYSRVRHHTQTNIHCRQHEPGLPEEPPVIPRQGEQCSSPLPDRHREAHGRPVHR